MTFDSSTPCVRTAAGDAELTLPALGLSLGQRRVLTLLQEPSAMAGLAQQHHLEPAKLERDLARLTDLRLVQWLGEPAAATPAQPTAATPMTPVVIGRARRTPAIALIAGIAVVTVAAGIWYGTRPRNPEGSQAPATLAAMPSPVTIATPGSTVMPPARAADEPASSVGMPATAIVPRGNATPPEQRAEIRPGLALVAAANSAPASSRGSSPAPAPASSPAPSPAPAPATSSALAPAPPIAAVAGPVERPAPFSNPENAAVSNSPVTAMAPPAIVPAVATPSVIDTSPPVQLAAANPSPAPRAAPPVPAPTPLKAISREPPDFPKEAIVEGLKSGVVTARLHVDARGKVTGVDILGAQPPRVFDRAVRRALLQWQFEPPATGAAADVDVDVKFQRD